MTEPTKTQPADSGIPQLTPSELKQRLDKGDKLRIIDVREPFEWDIVNLDEYGATLIPMAELAGQLDQLDPAEEVVVYCHTGRRSAFVVQQLRAAGYDRVWNLQTGIAGWTRDVDPSKPDY